MNTITFGTSSEPLRVASAGRNKSADDFGKKSDTDPERLLQCPFDKNHQIRSCRFPYHLIKCRKNHAKLAAELKSCPYNARHLVPKHEFNHHTETCEDKVFVDTEDDSLTNGNNWKVPLSTWVNPNQDESWEDEATDQAVPFVWGQNSAVFSRQEMKSMNHLGQSCRVPNSLPWLNVKR